MNPVIQEVKETYRRATEQADQLIKKVTPLDGELARKIQKVKENAGDVVKHLETRTDPKKNG